MAHPYAAHRQTKVEKSRVGHICKGYASGGAVKSIGKKSLSLHKSEHKALDAEGGHAKHRMDRPKRAKGGRVKKGNARTIVNVITGGHPAGGAVPSGPPMAPPPSPMGVAPAGMAPPMAAKPPMPMPPTGAPPGMPMRAKGGAVKSIGMDVGTKVQHVRGTGDLDQLDRGNPVTFKSGGRVRSFFARGGNVKDKSDRGEKDRLHFSPKEKPTSAGIYKADSNTTKERARGGSVMADKVAPATKLPGGGGGGEARLVKAHRAARDYHGPD